MDDRWENKVHRNPHDGFSREVLGAAWAGVVAHTAAAVCRAFRFGNDFPVWNYIQADDYLAAGIFIACISGYYTRFKKSFLIAWFVFALFCIFVSFADQWGETLLHGNDTQKRRFHGFAFLSDGLFAFGSAILLVSNIALVWAEWRRRN